MLVTIRNLNVFERSVPTPVNTSIPIKGNETIEFTYPKAFDWFFENLRRFNFDVETTTQLGDVRPNNPSLDFTGFDTLIKECLELLRETYVCNDQGAHIGLDDLWVDEPTYDTFKAAYEKALRVKQEANKQAEIDEVIETLNEAKQVFEDARQYGVAVDNELAKVAQYGFGDDGIVLGELLSLSDLKNNSFFVKLDSPLREDDEIVTTVTIDEHTYQTTISVDRHPEMATRSVTTLGETLVWSFGTSKSDTDIELVDGEPVSRAIHTWPVVPVDATLTLSNAEGEYLRGVDEIIFKDRPLPMTKGKVTNIVVTKLNFRYLDSAIRKAKNSLEGVVTSTDDGDDILPGITWVLPDQLEAIKTAIEVADGVKGVAEDQSTINEALSELETALATFESQKQDGRKGPYLLGVELLDNEKAFDSEGIQFYKPGTVVELQGERIAVKGALNFVESVVEEPKRETHYYLPLKFNTVDGRVLEIKDIDTGEEESHATLSKENNEFVLRVDKTTRTVKIVLYKNETNYESKLNGQEYIINCDLCRFENELPYITEVAVADGMLEGKLYSELYSSLTPTITGKKVVCNGELNFIDEWNAYPGDLNTNYFVPLRFNDIKDQRVIKCYELGHDDVEIKHYTVGNDRVLVFAISPEFRTRKITVYANNSNYENDERGQDYFFDFSNLVLKIDANPVKAAKLSEGSFEGVQYSDLVNPEFEITLDDHTIKCNGDFNWTDWPEIDGTHRHFLPLHIDLANGLIVAWYDGDKDEFETTHFTVTDDNKDKILKLSSNNPKQKFIVYTSMEAHNAKQDGVEYIIDCSECNYLAKPFEIHEAETVDDIKDALAQDPDYDGNIHVQLENTLEIDEELTIDVPAMFDFNGQDITASEDIVISSDVTLSNGNLTTTSEHGVVIDSQEVGTEVTIDSMVIDFTPETVDEDSIASAIKIVTEENREPSVTISDCTITATAPEVEGELHIVDMSGFNKGSLTLDGTDISTESDGGIGLFVDSDFANVSINNESSIAVVDRAIEVDKTATVTIDNSEVTGRECVYLGESAGNTTIDVVNGATLNGKTLATPEDEKSDTAVIVFNGIGDNVVSLDDTSKIECVGNFTNSEYVAAFLQGNDNTVDLHGYVTSEQSKNEFWFLHSTNDDDSMYFDKEGKGDNIIIEGTAANKTYIVDKPGVMMMSLSMPKSTIVNAANDLKTCVEVATKTQEGDDTKTIVITRGRFADDSDNDIDMPKGVIYKGYSNYINIVPAPEYKVMLDKHPSDVQEDVAVQENNMTAKITGTLPYVKWPEFSNNPEFQQGHYLALTVTKASDDVIQISTENKFTGSKTVLPENEDTIFYYIGEDKEEKGITITALTSEGNKSVGVDLSDASETNEVVFLNLKELELQDKPDEVSDFFTVEPMTDSYWGKEIDSIQNNLELAVDEYGMTVAVSGLSYYLSNWDEWNEGEEGNFIVLKFTPKKDVSELKFIGNNTVVIDDNVLAYKVSDTSNTFVVQATDDKGTHDVTFTLEGIEKQAKPEANDLFTIITNIEEPVLDKTVSDIQSNVVATVEGPTVDLSGTLHYVKSWEQFSKSAKGHFVVLKFEPKENVSKLIMSNNEGQTVQIDEDGLLVVNIVDEDSFDIIATTPQGEFNTKFTVTGLTLNSQIPEITFNVPTDDTYYEHTPEELQSNVAVDGNKVTGTLNYIANFGDPYPSDRQAGHFLVLTPTVEPENAKLEVQIFGDNPMRKEPIEIDDGYVVLYITDPKHQTVKFTATNKEQVTDVTLDLTDLAFAPEKWTDYISVKPVDGNISILEKEVSELQDGITLEGEGTTVAINGNLKWVHAWTQFSKSESDGNFLALKIKPVTIGAKLTAKSLNTQKEGPLDSDNYLVVRVNDNDYKFVVKVFNNGDTGSAKADHEITFTTDDLVLEPEPLEPVVTVSAPLGTETYYGEKTAKDLQYDIVVDEDSISGTLIDIDSYPEIFPDHPELQKGHYLALDFSAEPQESTIQVELLGGDTVMKGLVTVDDGWCVFHITDPETQTLHVVGTNSYKVQDKTYSLTNLTFEPAPAFTDIHIPGQDQSFKGVSYSQLMSPDTKATLGDHTIKVTGTLYRYNNWEAFGEALRNKNYLVLSTTVNELGIVRKQTKIDGNESKYTYSDDKSNDIVLALDDSHKTHTFTLYLKEEYAISGKGGVTYTIDCTDCIFETRTKEVMDKTPQVSIENEYLYEEYDSPTITLKSNKTFASEPTQEDLGLDLDSTSLEFVSATGDGTTCSITTEGLATVGTITVTVHPNAFEPSDGLLDADTVTIEVQPAESPELTTDTTIAYETESPDIKLTSNKKFDSQELDADDFVINWGNTGLEFTGASSSGDNDVTISTTGTAKGGTITIIAKPSAFEVSKGLKNSQTVTIEVERPLPNFTDVQLGDVDKAEVNGVNLKDYIHDPGVTLEGDTVTITGTLDQFSKDGGGETNYAIPLKFIGANKKYLNTKQLDGDEWSSEQLTDPYEVTVQFGPGHTTREVVLYDSEGDLLSESYGHTYTLDASGCQFNKLPDNAYITLAEGTIYDHNVSDFGTVSVNEDTRSGSITGTLKHCVGITPFTDERANGYFLPLDVKDWENGKYRVNRGGWSEWMDLDGDKMLLWCGDKELQLTEIEVQSGKDQSVRKYTVSVEKAKLTISLSKPNDDSDFYGKQAQELQGSIEVVDEEPDYSVSGTLHYVKGYDKAFPDNPDGHFLAMWINTDEKGATTSTELVGGTKGSVDVTTDKYCVYRITEPSTQKIKITVTLPNGDSREKEYDLSGLTLDKDPDTFAKLTEVKIADRSHAWKGVTYSDLYSEDSQATLDGNEITVTGTFYQKDNWEAVTEKNKWYPVINLAVENDKEAIKFFKLDGEPSSIHHFESGKPNDDVVFTIDESTKSKMKKLKVYSTESDAQSDINGKEYTINFSACKLLTNAQVDVDVAMASQDSTWKNVKYSQIQSPDASVQIKDDNTIKVTGTFYKLKNWEAFGESNQNKYYIATTLTRPSSSYLEGSDGRHMLANRLTDDIVFPFTSTQSVNTFTIYPSTEHKENNFAGKTYTFDFSEATLIDPYVTLSITQGKTYDIEDASELGSFNVEGNKITGTATKKAGVISAYKNHPEKQSGYYISVTAEPWDGEEVKTNSGQYSKLADNGKVLVYLGATESDVTGLDFKNTKANDHVDHFDVSIDCTPDDSIPTIKEVGYKATRNEFNQFLTGIGKGEDKMNVGDQVFYIQYSSPLDTVTDYLTTVEVKDHIYGVLHQHVGEPATVSYFSMTNGFQVDFVDGQPKTEENKTCDLTEYHGNATVALYKINGAANGGVYPDNLTKIFETSVTVE